MGIQARRAFRWSVRGGLALLVIAVAAGLLEHHREARDLAQLSASETFAQLGPARVRYRRSEGPAAGPLVVFVNGIGGCMEQWEPVQESVARFAPTLIYDNAGTGLSSGYTGHFASGEADELEALLTALSVERRIVLVSFSNSAQMARVFAQRHRERLAGLVFLNPYMPEIEIALPERHSILRTFARWLIPETLGSLVGGTRLVLHLRHHGEQPTPREHRVDAVLSRFPHWRSTDRQWLESAAVAREAIATPGFGDLPAWIVRTTDNETGLGARMHIQLEDELARRSSRGAVVDLAATGHSGALEGPGAQALSDAIHQLINGLP